MLEKSLYHETLIDLGLEARLDAVTRPWDVQVQMPDKPNRILPPGTPIADVFDEMQGELLILGAPGAGKTTMLLELTRDCIDRARNDDSLPIPVVFNLSSYTDPKQPLDTWLVNELINKYHTPKKVAQGWVEHDELLLLLDGLDEVKAETREACAQTINAFRQAHGLTMPLVVCSRIADYEALTTRLQLHGAVFLQPLTDRQIDDYFTSAGPELSAVRHAWQNDAELQELARQPLMLSIMTLAYRGITPEALTHEQAGSLSARRTHLFDAYIQQMFARVGRTKDERYTPEETKSWLTWLAQKMQEQGQSVFLLENMRRTWLSVGQRRLHRLIGGLVVGLLFGLVGILVSWAMTDYAFGLVGGLVFGLEFGLVFGLEFGPLFGLMFGLVFGLVMGELAGWFIGELYGQVKDGLRIGLVNGLMLYGLMGGLASGLAGGRMIEAPSTRLKWSWQKALDKLLFGMAVGLVIGLVITFVTKLTNVLFEGESVELAVKSVFGVGIIIISGFFIIVFGVLFGLVGGLQEAGIETSVVPNEGIRQSIKNGLVYGLAYGLAFGLLFGIWLGVSSVILFGAFFGMLFCLIYGGSAVINHNILRSLLYRNHHIPKNYEHFLNYAVEHLFLHQVGGGFVFVHRLLLEHFAGLASKKQVGARSPRPD